AGRRAVRRSRTATSRRSRRARAPRARSPRAVRAPTAPSAAARAARPLHRSPRQTEPADRRACRRAGGPRAGRRRRRGDARASSATSRRSRDERRTRPPFATPRETRPGPRPRRGPRHAGCVARGGRRAFRSGRRARREPVRRPGRCARQGFVAPALVHGREPTRVRPPDGSSSSVMGGTATPLVVFVFVAGAVATWIAGGLLSKTTDALDTRLGLGEELGGLLLLAIAGSLPELAITISAAASNNLGLAAGNLIGGIAVQTMVLVICDIAAGSERPLTYLVGALTPVLEGLLVVIVVAGVEMGALLKPSTAIGGVVSPASIAIAVVWGVGLYVINRSRKDPRWSITMPGSSPGRRNRRVPHEAKAHPFADASTGRVAFLFGVACAVTLV